MLVAGQPWLRWIMVSAESRQSSYVAQQQITSLLHDHHRIRPGDPDDFFVRNLADVAGEAGSVMTLLSIASISLLVGRGIEQDQFARRSALS